MKFLFMRPETPRDIRIYTPLYLRQSEHGRAPLGLGNLSRLDAGIGNIALALAKRPILPLQKMSGSRGPFKKGKSKRRRRQ
jgi:hypothetical protein